MQRSTCRVSENIAHDTIELPREIFHLIRLRDCALDTINEVNWKRNGLHEEEITAQ